MSGTSSVLQYFTPAVDQATFYFYDIQSSILKLHKVHLTQTPQLHQAGNMMSVATREVIPAVQMRQ